MANEASDSDHGCLAFDEHWKTNDPADTRGDKDEWDALARRYLALTPMQRFLMSRNDSSSRGGAFIDKALYACPDGDWSRVLLRMPELCDEMRFSSEEMHEEAEEELAEADDEMDRLTKRAVFRVYLVDGEALGMGLVKVLWLDCHGENVWENTISPGEIQDFTGSCNAFAGVGEILQTFAEGTERGARLRF
ncbi:hypothetical protein LA080_009708 [Diaporthe eres]|nr:hypothetical protein LA080_009708 [Diaporthe eres]